MIRLDRHRAPTCSRPESRRAASLIALVAVVATATLVATVALVATSVTVRAQATLVLDLRDYATLPMT
ncbi:MAG: hypothetical protein ABI652_02105, partial [Acidobacteriota bacterium]